MQIQSSFQEIAIFLIIWLFFVVLVEALVELALIAEPLEPIRTFFSRRSSFFAGLLSCGYCFSVWVAFSIAWILPSPMSIAMASGISNDFMTFTEEYLWWFVNAIILHRMSNIFHVKVANVQDFEIEGDINE